MKEADRLELIVSDWRSVGAVVVTVVAFLFARSFSLYTCRGRRRAQRPHAYSRRVLLRVHGEIVLCVWYLKRFTRGVWRWRRSWHRSCVPCHASAIAIAIAAPSEDFVCYPPLPWAEVWWVFFVYVVRGPKREGEREGEGRVGEGL